MRRVIEQFEIGEILRIKNKYMDITITKTTIYIIITILISNIIYLEVKKERYRKIIEELYIKIEEMGRNILPYKEEYIPQMIIILNFILLNNLLGIIPYSYTTTAQIIVTITLSLSIIIGITIIGLKNYSISYIKLFIPSGLNQGNIKYIIPLITFIEIISYLIRIISLSVRLTANMISGHILLGIITTYGIKLGKIKPILTLIPIILLMGLILLEIGVGLIQSYVFTLLMITYIKDGEYLH